MRLAASKVAGMASSTVANGTVAPAETLVDGPYFEETIYVTPSCEPRPVQAGLREAAQRAVTALGLQYGPVHAEMRVTSEGVFVLEVAARPIGGLCSKALRFESGRSLEEVILCHALGEDPEAEETLPGGVMMLTGTLALASRIASVPSAMARR